MTDFTTKQFNWRTDTFDPECRREWARLTDNRTYRGPHNICEPDSLMERAGRIIEHPMLVTYARVAFTGFVGLIGLSSVCVFLLSVGGA